MKHSRTLSLSSLAVAMLFLGNNAESMGQRRPYGYHFDETTKQCVNARGEAGHNAGDLGECGIYAAKEGEVLSLDRIHAELNGLILNAGISDGCEAENLQIQGAVLTGVLIRHAQLLKVQANQVQLVRVDFSDSKVEDAQFQKATFDSVNLTGASFARVDLRGAVFKNTPLDQVNLAGAIFDENSVLPFSCAQALSEGMVFKGQDAFYCDSTPPQEWVLSQDFLKAHPRVFAMIRDQRASIELYLTDELAIVPISPAEMDDEQMDDVLCAALLGMCLSNPDRVKTRYYLNSLPAPVLSRGIELYHTPTQDMESLGQGRAVSVFQVVRDPQLPPPDESGLVTSWQKDLELEWRKYWTAHYGASSVAEKLPPIHFRSILQDLSGLSYLPLWAQGESDLMKRTCSKKEGQLSFECDLEIDLKPTQVYRPGWGEQVLNDLIRKAELQSLSLGLELVPSLRNAFGTHFIVNLPVRAVNPVTVSAKHFRRL